MLMKTVTAAPPQLDAPKLQGVGDDLVTSKFNEYDTLPKSSSSTLMNSTVVINEGPELAEKPDLGEPQGQELPAGIEYDNTASQGSECMVINFGL